MGGSESFRGGAVEGFCSSPFASGDGLRREERLKDMAAIVALRSRMKSDKKER